MGVRILTRGVLNDVSITAEGSKVKLRMPIDRGQLEALHALAAGYLGVPLPPPEGMPPAAAPRPQRP